MAIRSGMNQINTHDKMIHNVMLRPMDGNLKLNCDIIIQHQVKSPDIRNSEILSNPSNGNDEGISLKPKECNKPDTRRNKDIRLL